MQASRSRYRAITAVPSPRLRPFASKLWWSASTGLSHSARESVLPTGHMHLVFRLDGPPLRTYASHDDLLGTVTREPVIGGARSHFYLKDAGAQVVSVGIALLPGAAQALFGCGAEEFSEAHTGLSGVWGADGARMLERIAEAGAPRDQLNMLDKLLCARLSPLSGMHPQIARAIQTMGTACRIDALVRESGLSHRSFIANFTHAAGMSPKRYASVARFQQVLQGIHAATPASLCELALAAGYSDQAHMNREFRQFTGMTPNQYRHHAPAAAHHVPLAAV